MNTASRPRWILLAILLAIPWLGVFALNFLPALDRFLYAGTFAGVMAVFVTIGLASIWLLFFSRLRWAVRWKGLALFALAGGIAAALVRKDGHMGDFMPQLAWRWQPRPGEGLEQLQVPASIPPDISFTTDQPGDSARFLGPDGSNFVSGSLLAADWHRRAPRELWRRPLGLGWSGFIVAGGFAITQEQRGDEELTVAYHLQTGQPLWQHAEKARFEESMGGNGPRATPTAHEGRVYALGATGILVCLDGRTGKLLWRRDTLAEAGHQNLGWAKSCSPLIAGDKVIITLGKGDRCLAAYAAATGEPAWRSGPGEASYASPVLAAIGGKPCVLAVLAHSAGAWDVANGAEVWSWTDGFKAAPAHAANPCFLPPDRVLVSIGYGVGSTLLSASLGAPPQIVWHSLKMKPKFTNLVVRGTKAWGLDEGRLSCMDLATGEQLWRGSSYGHGQITGVGDSLLIQAERGEVVIVEASESEEIVRSRFPALTSKTWNQPCLAGRHLLVRNDREAVCFELPGQTP